MKKNLIDIFDWPALTYGAGVILVLLLLCITLGGCSEKDLPCPITGDTINIVLEKAGEYAVEKRICESDTTCVRSIGSFYVFDDHVEAVLFINQQPIAHVDLIDLCDPETWKVVSGAIDGR